MRLSDIATLATACTLTTVLLAAPGAAAALPDDRAAAPVVRLQPDRGTAVRSFEVLVTAADSGPRRTSTYSMIGLTWRGADPTLRVRSRGTDGWSDWLHADVMSDGPGDATATPLRATDLLWVGPSDGVQVDVRGRGHRDLTMVLIDPGRRTTDRTAGEVPAVSARAVAPANQRAPQPELIGRKQWGADPTWRNGAPVINGGLRHVSVHHTVSANDYTRAQVPGILRGMYRYHTGSLGWSDLGYNFVVDRFGRSWVGRAGGVAKPVRGAHTLGFNHASVGISVIGNFEAAKPSNKAVTAVVRLAAWKLDRHRHDALGRVTVRSEGSDRFGSGRQVSLPVIAGHRATNETACPGELLHARLPDIRHRAQRRIDRY